MLRRLLQLLGLAPEYGPLPLVARSPKWPALRDAHLRRFPACAVCGSRVSVVPHHIIPVHLDSSQELDPENLLSLCEGATVNCHLLFGHCRSWSSYNPNVVFDAATWREKIRGRPKF